jgi:hypothetical protein
LYKLVAELRHGDLVERSIRSLLESKPSYDP